MQRARFNRLVQQALDSLPAQFRRRIENVAVVVEDLPPGQAAHAGEDNLVMGVFEGVAATERSVWAAPPGPSRIVLYQKNIEDVCASDDEIREEIRLTVLHEFGHYFGLDENQLKDI